MTSQRSRQLAAAALAAAFLAASAGPVIPAGSGQQAGDAPRAGKAEVGTPTPDDQVEALVREHDDARAAMMRRAPGVAAPTAKDLEALRAEMRKSAGRREDVARRLLELAGRHPRTNAAEQALTWVTCNMRSMSPSPEAERARELLAGDYVRSDRIKAVLAETSSVVLWGSRATENLLRRALERSPYHDIRGLACYRLAELLIERADRVRVWQLLGSPPQADDRRIGGGPEQVELLRASDPGRLEAEAAALLERVIAEFPRVSENHNGTNRLGIHLETPAKTELDRLRRLSVGKPAPEITGVDLDGKPMRLSEFRGKVVLLYFSPMFSFDRQRAASRVAEGLRKYEAAFAGKPFAIAGVITWQLDSYREEARDGRLPGRYWVDEAGRDQLAGPIHAAWDCTGEDAFATDYVLDPRGTIRYNRPGDPALINKAVTRLLEEPSPAGRAD